MKSITASSSLTPPMAFIIVFLLQIIIQVVDADLSSSHHQTYFHQTNQFYDQSQERNYEDTIPEHFDQSQKRSYEGTIPEHKQPPKFVDYDGDCDKGRLKSFNSLNVAKLKLVEMGMSQLGGEMSRHLGELQAGARTAGEGIEASALSTNFLSLSTAALNTIAALLIYFGSYFDTTEITISELLDILGNGITDGTYIAEELLGLVDPDTECAAFQLDGSLEQVLQAVMGRDRSYQQTQQGSDTGLLTATTYSLALTRYVERIRGSLGCVLSSSSAGQLENSIKLFEKAGRQRARLLQEALTLQNDIQHNSYKITLLM